MKRIISSTVLLCICVLCNAQETNNANSFFEDFNDSTSKYFRYGSTGTKADFKFTMGIQSPTEPGIKILSFKLDPEDRAGAGRGPEIISNQFTHFGTYA